MIQVEQPMFHDPVNFPFTAELAACWRQIHQEFLGIQCELMDWVERDLYDEGWQVFGLFNFPHGEPIDANIVRCPHTATLIQSQIPRHGAAGFSVLKPGTQIRPHRGFPGNYLRCHLGLSIPPGDCALRVQQEVRYWQPGGVLVFDDRVEHEAWNFTPHPRVLLLVDFVP